jgi:hypothetical protein
LRSLFSLCVHMCRYVYAFIVARQRLGRHVPVEKIHATIELLEVSFSMRSVRYQRKVGDYFFLTFSCCGLLYETLSIQTSHDRALW